VLVTLEMFKVGTHYTDRSLFIKGAYKEEERVQCVDAIIIKIIITSKKRIEHKSMMLS